MAKKHDETAEDERVGRQRLQAFQSLPLKTQAAVNASAQQSGYKDYKGMVSFFVNNGVYKFFERAMYGWQEGLTGFLANLKKQFNKVFHKDSSRTTQTVSGDEAEFASMQMVLDDIGQMLAESHLEGAEAQAAVATFLSGGEMNNDITVKQGR